MKAKEVQPQKWQQDKNYPIRVLYDDGEYSVIFGKYIDTKSLGVRWNGGTKVGYPGQGAHPTWYVEPDFIAISILHRIQGLAVDNGDNEYIENIKFAINELADKMLKN